MFAFVFETGDSFWEKPLRTQLAQRLRDNVVKTSWLTLSQRRGTAQNESYGDVGLQRCDNVAVRRCQDVVTTLLQRRRNIKHLVSRPFY